MGVMGGFHSQVYTIRQHQERSSNEEVSKTSGLWMCAVRVGLVLITSVGVHCGWYHSLGLGPGLCEN